MSYSIIRMQKLKAPSIREIQIHNQRERGSETDPDIEKEKSNLNDDLLNTEKIDYVEAVEKKIKLGVKSTKRIRNDAVRLCEFVITSDNDFFENLTEKEEKKFFENGLKYLQVKYGSENIIYATIHKDEKSPHMHVGFIPITGDNRLAANSIFTRLELVMLQDDFIYYMSEAGFNLKRGTFSKGKRLAKPDF